MKKKYFDIKYALNFNLKYEFFNLFRFGEKTHEYRLKTDYWEKRISKLNAGDYVRLIKGYTNLFLSARVVSIELIAPNDAPYYVYELFNFDCLDPNTEKQRIYEIELVVNPYILTL